MPHLTRITHKFICDQCGHVHISEQELFPLMEPLSPALPPGWVGMSSTFNAMCVFLCSTTCLSEWAVAPTKETTP